MKKIILLTTVIAVIFSMTCFVHADTSGGETDPEDMIIEEDTGAPADPQATSCTLSFGKNLIYKGPRPGFCAKTKGLLHHIRDISAEKEKRCLLICGQRQQDCTSSHYQSHPHIHGTVHRHLQDQGRHKIQEGRHNVFQHILSEAQSLGRAGERVMITLTT